MTPRTSDQVEESLASIIAGARRRLGRNGIRTAIARHAYVLCGAAAMCAATRPLVWPLHAEDPWKAAVRAFVLASVGAGGALVVVIVQAWRTRPTMLASARRLDAALGRAEEVASGFAFERDARRDEMAVFAIKRASSLLDGVVIDRVLAPSPYVKTRKERRWLAVAVAVSVLGIAFGAIDRIVLERTIHPVTSRESTAASDLKTTAQEAAAAFDPAAAKAPNPKAEAMVDAARRASEAAKRGDRRSASDALEEMRKAARSLEGDEREQARALRALRDEIEASAAAATKSPGSGSGDKSSSRPSATASDALAKLMKELDAKEGDSEALRKMIERLERAETAARAAGERAESRHEAEKKGSSPSHGSGTKEPGKSGWSRAAEALAEAREAAARGDKEAAKRAMERAEREISAMEKASSDPSRSSAMARLSEEASELDRSMHAATTGETRPGREEGASASGSPGEKGGREGSSKSSARGKDDGEKGDPSGEPGTGPGKGERGGAGAEQRRLKVDGDLQARADVRAGERAVSVIEGMGRGGDPRAYREIFPSYDTVVEDGLREDAVPAVRRPTVRRYFSSIRPGANDGTTPESRKAP